MSTEWTPYWQDVRNLRWTVVDQVVLEKVAGLLGWGPTRSLLELGAGRGLHSRRLYETMRCDRPDLYEVSPEMLAYMKRQGLNAIGDERELRRQYDIVWSYGVPEHFEGPERQAIIDRHFELAREWVVLVIPRRTWARRAFGRRDRVGAHDFTEAELRARLRAGAEKHWSDSPAGIEHRAEAFCPLFGIRHVPDALYPVAEKLIGWALPGGLLIGHARRTVQDRG